MTRTSSRCPTCGGLRVPLIDLVRRALEMEPDATLGRVLWLTGSRDMSMVATLMRMVRLRAERATVQALPTIQPAQSGTSPRPDAPVPGSLRASRSGAA